MDNLEQMAILEDAELHVAVHGKLYGHCFMALRYANGVFFMLLRMASSPFPREVDPEWMESR